MAYQLGIEYRKKGDSPRIPTNILNFNVQGYTYCIMHVTVPVERYQIKGIELN